jgi:23S rRNA pseudouridine2605 synthase
MAERDDRDRPERSGGPGRDSGAGRRSGGDRGSGAPHGGGGYRGRSDDRRDDRPDRGGYRGRSDDRRDDRPDRGGYRGRSDDRRDERPTGGGYRGRPAGSSRDEEFRERRSGGFGSRGEGQRGRTGDRREGGYRGRTDDRPGDGYRGRSEDRSGGAQRGRSDERSTGAQRGRDDRSEGGYRGRDDRGGSGYRGRDDRGGSGYRGRDDRNEGGYRGRDDRAASGYRGRDDRSEGGYRGRSDDRYDRDRDRDRDRSDGRSERPAGEGSSRVWHNGRRYVGGTANPRNARRPDRPAAHPTPSPDTTPRPAGELDEHGLPVEGTPERPIIPEWNEGEVARPGEPGLPSGTPLHTGERLQKVLAAAGIASRRVAESLIVEGRVTVNGDVVEELGRRVDPEADEIAVDGVAVQSDATRRYLILNKPTGVVSTMLDDRGRPDLSQFVEKYEERLFNVGRLDAETSGLLVLTNDGGLAHVLAHPSFGVTKTYIAKVRGSVTPATIQRLIDGVELEDGPISADKARLLEGSRDSSLVEITLHSGRNRIVRRMLDEVGHPVQELVRRSFGPLHLGTLGVGRVRELTSVELGKLLTISRGATAPASAREDDSED